MFVFEILLIVSVLLCLVATNLKKQPISYLLLAAGFGVFILHTKLNGLRWQLVPVYFVLIYLLIHNLSKKPVNKIGLGFGIFCLASSVVLANLLPNILHNKNTGMHFVGTYTFEVIDGTTQRALPTKVWFPIESTQSLVKAHWMQNYMVTGPKIAKLAGMPGFIFQHLANSKPTYLSNPSRAINSNKPLVLLSHGRGAVKEFNAFMAQEFASHGYVVIAADHTKGALLSVLNNGTNVPFDPKEFGENEGLSPEAKQDRVQKLGKRWALDLDSVLFEFQNQFPTYRNRKVIVGGHSTGGGSTMQYCSSEKNCLGVIGLDPWFEPTSDEILAMGINKPLLSLFSDPYEKDFEAINHQRYENIENAMKINSVFAKEVVIAKAGHVDFCDAALLSPYSYLFGQDKGKIKAQRVMTIINQHALDFSDALANGQDLNTIKWQKFPEEMNWVNIE